MLRLHDSLTRRKSELIPLEAGRVRMYVCGITVYDYCHIGHARMLVVFDVLARWIRAAGLQLVFVRNITDIDDKIIRRAVQNRESVAALTDRFIAAMHEDEASLGNAKPDHEPRATQYLAPMQNLISRLMQRGLAYQSGSGDINFAVRRFDGYGKLSGKSLDDLRAGERVDVDRDKQDPLDFVLWKSAKPDEPAEVKWDSPFGVGRPGWHIECSAMSCSLLGESFDIHGGGHDLQFPHHENEIAQSEGATGKPLARIWVHNGFVNIDDQKMSKSLGNFFTIRTVLEQFDGEVIRFMILRSHYRSPLNFSDVALEEARVSLLRLYGALSDAARGDTAPVIDWTEPVAARFKQCMDDDMNTPEAIAVLFELANTVNRQRQSGAGAAAPERLLRALAGCLGLLRHAPSSALQTGLRGAGRATIDQAQILELIEQRGAAKKARDFALADQIRDRLAAAGIELLDSARGTEWRRK